MLPLGLPWSGRIFRIDALSAFFLAVVDFGAAAAVSAIGYGRHGDRCACYRSSVFLAGMNLVLIADDAFTFLLAWEFMSRSPPGRW